MIAGCGSSDSENADGTNAGGSKPNESDDNRADGGEDGSTDEGGESGRYEYCNRKAEIECAALKPCCEAEGIAYDRAGCESLIRGNCEKLMDRIQAGELGFDEEMGDACLEQTKALYAKCTFESESEYLAATFFIPEDACNRVFFGLVEPGGSCATSLDCKPPADWAQKADCDEGKCVVKPRLLAEGEDCKPGVALQCAEGLYCPGEGKCRKTYALGEDCAGPFVNDACGSDAHCSVDGQCEPLYPVGADCDTYRDCASDRCVEGKCVPLSVASDIVCRGTSGGN